VLAAPGGVPAVLAGAANAPGANTNIAAAIAAHKNTRVMGGPPCCFGIAKMKI